MGGMVWGQDFPAPLHTRRGMTSFVTRKRSRWKSEMMSRKMEEVFWDRYVAKLWKSWGEGTVTKRSQFLFGSTHRYSCLSGYCLQCSGTFPKSDPRLAD